MRQHVAWPQQAEGVVEQRRILRRDREGHGRADDAPPRDPAPATADTTVAAAATAVLPADGSRPATA